MSFAAEISDRLQQLFPDPRRRSITAAYQARRETLHVQARGLALLGGAEAAGPDQIRLASDTVESAHVALKLNGELLRLERLDRKSRQLQHEREALHSLRRSALALLGGDDQGDAGVREPRRPQPFLPSGAQCALPKRSPDASPIS